MNETSFNSAKYTKGSSLKVSAKNSTLKWKYHSLHEIGFFCNWKYTKEMHEYSLHCV